MRGRIALCPNPNPQPFSVARMIVHMLLEPSTVFRCAYDSHLPLDTRNDARLPFAVPCMSNSVALRAAAQHMANLVAFQVGCDKGSSVDEGTIRDACAL